MVTYRSIVVALLFFNIVSMANTEVTPTIVARSQGRDAMRKLVGVSGQVHQYDAGRYVNLTAMPEYTQTFRGNRIARCLFGNDVDNCGNVKIQGSAITGEDRCDNAWLADYFYLPPDYNSHFTIEPRIQNAARCALRRHQAREQHVRIQDDLHFLRRRVRASLTASLTSASTCFSGILEKAWASSSRIRPNSSSSLRMRSNSAMSTRAATGFPALVMITFPLRY